MAVNGVTIERSNAQRCKVCDAEKREASRWLRVYVGSAGELVPHLIARLGLQGAIFTSGNINAPPAVFVSAFDAALPGDPVCGIEHAVILLSRFHGEVVVGKRE